jgi:hypothetical protein
MLQKKFGLVDPHVIPKYLGIARALGERHLLGGEDHAGR